MSEEWGKVVEARLRRLPSGGFEAATVSGVSMLARIVVERETSATALDALFSALSAFGYEGKVMVEGMTYIGRAQRYEVAVS